MTTLSSKLNRLKDQNSHSCLPPGPMKFTLHKQLFNEGFNINRKVYKHTLYIDRKKVNTKRNNIVKKYKKYSKACQHP